MKTILQDTFERAAALYDQGDETGARQIIAERFLALPKELQGEILALNYIESLEERAATIDDRLKLLKEGIELYERLETVKEKLIEESEHSAD